MLATGNCAFSCCWYINLTEAYERLLQSHAININALTAGSTPAFSTYEARLTCSMVSRDHMARKVTLII